MSIPVQFKNASRDTIICFSNTFTGQLFAATIPFPVDSVLFDPDYQLISGNNMISAANELPRPRKLHVFPNPAGDRLTFDFRRVPINNSGKICIYDCGGRLMAKVKAYAGETAVILDTQGFSPGVYSYILRQQDFQYSGEFVIVR